jgi:hypothetical protein
MALRSAGTAVSCVQPPMNKNTINGKIMGLIFSPQAMDAGFNDLSVK